MAGIGPPPKPAATRQRSNKPTTAAKFETSELEQKAPALGRHPVKGVRWHERTRRWWREVWESPMAPEFLRADTDGLLMLAALIDRFWWEPSAPLAAEIRLQRQCYGLTPIDRRRLQWEIVRVRDAQQRPPRRGVPQLPPGDPRAALRAI